MFYTEVRIRHEPGEKHKMWLDLTMECINMAWLKFETNYGMIQTLKKHGMENEENSSVQYDPAWLRCGMRAENSRKGRIISYGLEIQWQNTAW